MKDKKRLISIWYPLKPGLEQLVEQRVELPLNVGLMTLEMVLQAINDQTMLVAHLIGEGERRVRDKDRQLAERRVYVRKVR